MTSRQTVLQAGEHREWSLAAAVRVRSQRSEDRVLQLSVRPGLKVERALALHLGSPPCFFPASVSETLMWFIIE